MSTPNGDGSAGPEGPAGPAGSSGLDGPGRSGGPGHPGHPARPARHARVYRCVVADDAAGIRALVSTLLTLEPDFEVVGQASDGAQAVEVVTTLQPDLLVIDVSMPVMSGVDAIKAIRRTSPSTVIAVLSGEHHHVPEGAQALIQKGTPNEVVIATLRDLCQAGQHPQPSS